MRRCSPTCRPDLIRRLLKYELKTSEEADLDDRLPTMLMGLFALLLGCRLDKTVASMTAAMRQLDDGRFDVVLPGSGSKK